MGTLIVVDCEAPFGVGAPSVGDMTEFGAVDFNALREGRTETFHGTDCSEESVKTATSGCRCTAGRDLSSASMSRQTATKLDDRRLSGRTHREQRSEISIREDDDSMLGGGALEDHIVVGMLQSLWRGMAASCSLTDCRCFLPIASNAGDARARAPANAPVHPETK